MCKCNKKKKRVFGSTLTNIQSYRRHTYSKAQKFSLTHSHKKAHVGN